MVRKGISSESGLENGREQHTALDERNAGKESCACAYSEAQREQWIREEKARVK